MPAPQGAWCPVKPENPHFLPRCSFRGGRMAVFLPVKSGGTYGCRAIGADSVHWNRKSPEKARLVPGLSGLVRLNPK